MRAALVLLGHILQHRLQTLVIRFLQLFVFARRKGNITGPQAVVMQEDDT